MVDIMAWALPNRSSSSKGRTPRSGAEVGELRAEKAELRAKLEALEAELEKLKREMGRDSSNSGKPPSSDTLARTGKPGRRAALTCRAAAPGTGKGQEVLDRTGKAPSWQAARGAGAALAKVDLPDRVVVHSPVSCARCGQGLGEAEVTGTEVRQVFDLPDRHLEVTEHQAQSRRCSCGATTKAPFPAEAKGPASYGPVVRAVAVYLMVGQHLPVARAAELLWPRSAGHLSPRAGWPGSPLKRPPAWCLSLPSCGRS